MNTLFHYNLLIKTLNTFLDQYSNKPNYYKTNKSVLVSFFVTQYKKENKSLDALLLSKLFNKDLQALLNINSIKHKEEENINVSTLFPLDINFKSFEVNSIDDLHKNIKSVNASNDIDLDNNDIDFDAFKDDETLIVKEKHNSPTLFLDENIKSFEALKLTKEKIKDIDALKFFRKTNLEAFFDKDLKDKKRYEYASIYTKKNNINILRRFLKHMYNEFNSSEALNCLELIEEEYRLDLKSLKIEHISFNDFNVIKDYLLGEANKQKSFELEYDKSKTVDENRNALSRKFSKIRNLMALKLVVYAGIKSEELKNVRTNDIKKLKISYELKLKRRVEKDNESFRRLKILASLIDKELEFMNKYFEAFNRDNELLMVSSRKDFRVLDNKEISYFVHKLFNDLNITLPENSKAGLYILRHTFALNLIKEKRKLQTLRRRLGLVKTAMAKEYYDYYNLNFNNEA